MNNGFFRYFQDLAAKARTTTNSDEAAKIKNKLIKTGMILTVIGGIGTFACFVSFTILSFISTQNFGEGFGFVLIPFFLIIPFALVASIGTVSLRLGLGITVAKVTAEFIDNNKYCPNCGDVVKEGELFCDHCGEPLLSSKICKNCHTENDLESLFCKKCGKKL